MNIWSVLMQGIVQGLTEFLPVSSSGHLSLIQYLWGQSGEESFYLSIVLHGGTLAAVFLCFYKQIGELFKALFTLGKRDKNGRRDLLENPSKRTLLCMMLSCVPLLIAPILSDYIGGFSTDGDITVEGFCFLITGVLLLVSGGIDGEKDGKSVTWQDALVIGAGQLGALMPGISRSGTTVSLGRMRGFEREYAVSYSFILGMPAVLGAIILETKSALEAGLDIPIYLMVTGFVTSMVCGIGAIRLVQWLVKGDKFRYFGYYMLGLGAVVLALGLTGVI